MIRISAGSIWILDRIDQHIRYCNIRGPIKEFIDVAADPLDGLVLRSELGDLIRRRLLTIVDYGFDDSMGRDIMRDSDPRLCGTSWSVNPTNRLILALWPDRVTKPRQKTSAFPAREPSDG
jgi:hypothetical protein